MTVHACPLTHQAFHRAPMAATATRRLTFRPRRVLT